jgi:fucose 4-O-acetylase-like acetyltransferase
MKNNILWVNNLKVFGILAVILGHIASPLGSFIYSWHMPLFFILSGFFIKFNLPIKEFFIKDFQRLMVPYFLFALVGLVMEALKRIALHRDSLDYVHEIKGVFIWMDMTSLINSYAFVLWFLPTLFFARMLLVVIHKCIESIAFQFIIVAILFTTSFFVELPFAIDNSLNAILFLFIGNIFYKSYQEKYILYSLPFIAAALYLVYGIPSLDIATKNYNNIILNIFFSVSVIYIMIAIFKRINYSNKLLTIWGDNIMLLFIVHPYTNNIAHIMVETSQFGDWYRKFFISLALLQIILCIKQKF